jgi:transposase InsO family protein
VRRSFLKKLTAAGHGNLNLDSSSGHEIDGLKIRHDHGSQYVADDFQDELVFLGMIASPSFVREPEGNGCAERFIQTLKENLLWVQTFETVEQLRLALLEFRKN